MSRPTSSEKAAGEKVTHFVYKLNWNTIGRYILWKITDQVLWRITLEFGFFIMMLLVLVLVVQVVLVSSQETTQEQNIAELEPDYVFDSQNRFIGGSSSVVS